MGTRIWVDGLSQRVYGSRRSLRQSLVRGLMGTRRQLTREGLAASPKSVALCSHLEGAQSISQQLRRA
eukprot:7493649-Pyramimonas_sp.AAC.1